MKRKIIGRYRRLLITTERNGGGFIVVVPQSNGVGWTVEHSQTDVKPLVVDVELFSKRAAFVKRKAWEDFLREDRKDDTIKAKVKLVTRYSFKKRKG